MSVRLIGQRLRVPSARQLQTGLGFKRPTRRRLGHKPDLRNVVLSKLREFTCDLDGNWLQQMGL